MKQLFTLSCIAVTILFICFADQLLAQSSKTSTIQFASDQYVGIFATAVDTGDRIISVGEFIDSAYIQGTKQGFSGKDSADAFVVCTDEQGNIIWKDIFGAPYATWANNVKCDNSGNYYVSGYFEKGFAIDGITFDSTAYYNAFLMKLDHNGKAIWGISYPFPYSEVGTENIAPILSCDANGNLYYLIQLTGPLKIGTYTFKNSVNIPQSSLLIKFDQSGNIVWGNVFANKGGTFFIGDIQAVAADLYGHVYICGGTVDGNINWGGSKIPGVIDTVAFGLFIAKLNATTGKMIWMQRGVSGHPFTQMTNIIIGGDGALYTAGYFADTLNMEGQKIPTVHGTADALVMNFDTSGKLKWFQHFGDPVEPDVPNGFCLDHSDNVYIGGVYDAPITLNSKTLFLTKARDVYVIRFDRSGNYVGSISSKAVSTQSYTGMMGLMTDAHNKLFVTGFLDNQTNFGGDTLSCFGPSSSFIWEVASTFTGIEPEIQELQNSFRLYPNPLSGNSLNLQVTNNAARGNMEISCFDETGRLVFSQVLQPADGVNDSYSLSLPNIKSGLYFVRLVSENGINVQKFIKN